MQTTLSAVPTICCWQPTRRWLGWGSWYVHTNSQTTSPSNSKVGLSPASTSSIAFRLFGRKLSPVVTINCAWLVSLVGLIMSSTHPLVCYFNLLKIFKITKLTSRSCWWAQCGAALVKFESIGVNALGHSVSSFLCNSIMMCSKTLFLSPVSTR